MLPRITLPSALLVVVLWASPAQAVPVYFTIDNCVSGDCSAFDQSGRGAIVAALDVINGNDLLITLWNALNAEAIGDDPHLTNLGFEYSGLLGGLTFDSFTVLSGNVLMPTFTVDSSIRSFFIDFGFGFSQDGRTSTRDGRFQAMDPNEVVQIVIGTTGQVSLSDFVLGVAKVGGAGTDGLSSAIVLTGLAEPYARVAEPTSLLLVGLGMAAYGGTRRYRGNALESRRAR